VPVHLADLEAVGIRVLRNGEVFGTFAASIPNVDRVDPGAAKPGYATSGDARDRGDERLWRAVLDAGSEAVSSAIEKGLANGELPPREPLEARKVQVSLVRVQELYGSDKDLPALDGDKVFEFELSDS
jgi:hypothetical protein